MNKFIKYGSVAGVLLILTGVGVTTAAFAMGGSFQRINDWFRDRYEIQYGDVSSWRERYEARYGYGDGWERAAEGIIDGTFDAIEDSLEISGTVVSADNWHAEFPTVTELKIENQGGSFEVVTSDDVTNLTLDGKGGDVDRTSLSQENGNAVLELRALEGEELFVRVPSAWYLSKIEVDMDFGSFLGMNLMTDNLEVDAGDGTVTISQTAGKTVELDCRYGHISWQGAGENLSILDAEANSGVIQIQLMPESPWTEFSGKLECEEGKIDTPDFVMKEWEKRRISGSSTERFLDLEAKDGGVIEIR